MKSRSFQLLMLPCNEQTGGNTELEGDSTADPRDIPLNLVPYQEESWPRLLLGEWLGTGQQVVDNCTV